MRTLLPLVSLTLLSLTLLMRLRLRLRLRVPIRPNHLGNHRIQRLRTARRAARLIGHGRRVGFRGLRERWGVDIRIRMRVCMLVRVRVRVLRTGLRLGLGV